MSSRRIDHATIALFLVGLCAPALDQLVRPDEARDTLAGERRQPAPRAGLPRSAAELMSFPRRFEAHYDDTFGLRDVLLEANALEQWFLVGRSPSPWIEPGSEGWCFMGGQSRAVHRGLLPLRDDELEAWVHGVLARRDFLAARGIRYLFVLCPSKQTVYPERVPDGWNPVGATRLEQLAARMAREPDSPFLDLRPALTDAKASDRPEDWLYTRFGTHWNGRGGHAVYQAILTRLQRDFPALEPIPAARWRAVEAVDSTESLAHQLYLARWIHQRQYALQLPERGYVVTVPSGYRSGSRLVTRKEIEAPRLLWLHDSFGPFLETLLCESFSSVQAHWTNDFPAEALFEARPEVVLETHTERLLIEGEPYPALDIASESPQAAFERARVLWRADAEFTGVGAQHADAERGPRGLRVTPDARGGLLLPALELAPGSQALLRVEADCAEPVEVEALVRPTGARSFGRKNRTRSELGPETRAAVLRLPVVGPHFETLVRFRTLEASLEVRTLEVRLAPVEAR